LLQIQTRCRIDASESERRLELLWYDRAADVEETLWDIFFPLPHEGLFWFRALEEGSLTEQFTFAFGVLRVDGSPAGIIPCFLFDLPLDLIVPRGIALLLRSFASGSLHRFAHQRTFFVGNVAGEEGHVGLGPGDQLAEYVTFIHDRVRAKAQELGARMVVWKEFPESDRTALDALVATRRVFRTISYPGTELPVVGGGFTDYLKTIRSDRRWKIKDKLRRGAEKISIETSVIKCPDETELREIFGLFWQTYSRGRTKFERLTPQFFKAIAASEVASFVVQRDAASKKLLAFMLVLNLGSRVINQFIGIDYSSAAGGFLYFRLFAAAYDWACTTPAGVLQSGQTGYAAKLDLGHRLVPLWNYCEVFNRLLQWVYRRVGESISWESLDEQLADYVGAHGRPAARP
jgi:hypothetical protein